MSDIRFVMIGVAVLSVGFIVMAVLELSIKTLQFKPMNLQNVMIIQMKMFQSKLIVKNDYKIGI